jgi:hypothetical protein
MHRADHQRAHDERIIVHMGCVAITGAIRRGSVHAMLAARVPRRRSRTVAELMRSSVNGTCATSSSSAIMDSGHQIFRVG